MSGPQIVSATMTATATDAPGRGRRLSFLDVVTVAHREAAKDAGRPAVRIVRGKDGGAS